MNSSAWFPVVEKCRNKCLSKREKYVNNSFCSNSYPGFLSGNSKIKYYNSPWTPLSGRQFVLIEIKEFPWQYQKAKNKHKVDYVRGQKRTFTCPWYNDDYLLGSWIVSNVWLSIFHTYLVNFKTILVWDVLLYQEVMQLIFKLKHSQKFM